MRIALDRKLLLGFETSGTDLGVPAQTSKVGTKDTIVPSASHNELTKTLRVPTETTLTFPVKTA